MTKTGLRKKGINGRSKGAGFENDICKLLTVWWGDEFHRTPASGGLHWKKVDSVGGDVICEDKAFPLSTECKKQEEWNFDQIVMGTGDVYLYWAQCINDAEEHGKTPWLVFSKNLKPKFFMMYKQDLDALLTKVGEWHMDLIIVNRQSPKNFGAPVVIGYLDQFLNTITREHVLKTFSIKSK